MISKSEFWDKLCHILLCCIYLHLDHHSIRVVNAQNFNLSCLTTTILGPCLVMLFHPQKFDFLIIISLFQSLFFTFPLTGGPHFLPNSQKINSHNQYRTGPRIVKAVCMLNEFPCLVLHWFLANFLSLHLQWR